MVRSVDVIVTWLFVIVTTSALRLSDVSGEEDYSYKGFKLLNLKCNDSEALTAALQFLNKNDFSIDVLSRFPNSADVLVAPDQLRDVTSLLANQRIRNEVSIDDFQSFLEKDFAERARRKKRAVKDLKTEYLDYNEMESYLRSLNGRSDKVADVEVSTIGSTFEGKKVYQVEIREKSSVKEKKNVILIDAGIHAREWIAPATALNFIDKLVFDSSNADMLELFDWVIVPSVNPDGYDYSHSSPSARLWRKTRTTKYQSSAYQSTCRYSRAAAIGVDGNRNFDYDYNPDIGASRCPRDDTYAGPKSFSEPETQNIRDWMRSYQNRAKAYISIHSYGQYLLYPYGSNQYKTLENKQLMADIGNKFRDEMLAAGYQYTIGNSAAVLYAAAGGSDDYAVGGVKIPVGYTLELPPKSNWIGFRLDKNQISTVSDATWRGVRVLAKAVNQAYPNPAEPIVPVQAPVLSAYDQWLQWVYSLMRNTQGV